MFPVQSFTFNAIKRRVTLKRSASSMASTTTSESLSKPENDPGTDITYHSKAISASQQPLNATEEISSDVEDYRPTAQTLVNAVRPQTSQGFLDVAACPTSDPYSSLPRPNKRQIMGTGTPDLATPLLPPDDGDEIKRPALLRRSRTTSGPLKASKSPSSGRAHHGHTSMVVPTDAQLRADLNTLFDRAHTPTTPLAIPLSASMPSSEQSDLANNIQQWNHQIVLELLRAGPPPRSTQTPAPRPKIHKRLTSKIVRLFAP